MESVDGEDSDQDYGAMFFNKSLEAILLNREGEEKTGGHLWNIYEPPMGFCDMQYAALVQVLTRIPRRNLHKIHGLALHLRNTYSIVQHADPTGVLRQITEACRV
ncbi:hypothetical protein HAX54_002079 [Datura stramonium]|uniref:Uncharacterized protein n=1 Tax=Datura stramonium TaxID=4076 RepID=A0ABS8T438_DATST|nr:hypothetical protein [Datura stramonium]